MNRPLVWVAGSMLVGVLAASWSVLAGPLLPLAVVCAGLILGALALHDPRVRPFAVVMCFVGLGAVVWEVNDRPQSDAFSRYAAEHPRAPVAVTGTVRGVQLVLPGDRRFRFTLDIDFCAVDGREIPLPGRSVVDWERPVGAIYPGLRVTVNGTPRVAIAEANPGVRGYEEYLRNRGIHSAIDASGKDAVAVLAPAPWYSPWYWAARMRQKQADNLAQCMPADALPFVFAVWLGHQSALRHDEYQAYVWSGTAHILSVSGIHAAIVALTLGFALRALQFGRRRRALLVMLAVCAYALVSGASAPALRAAIMVCLYLCADLLEREPDTPSALSVAGIIFLLWDPHSAFDLGFQLSFASVASILIFTSILEEKLTRLHRYFRAPLAVSLSVQILPLPIAAANFHALPVTAPLANLAAIPILGAVLWLCFATSLLSFAWVPAAQIAGYAAWLPIAALREVAYAGSSLRPLSLALTTPTTTAWALYWSAAALLIASTMVVPRRRKAVLAVAFAVFIASVVLWRNRAHEPEVVMLDVGHGDATFIRWPGGETLLIDGGDASEYVDRGRQIVAPFLWARGYTRLDAVMASHADRDHLGGLIYVVDNFRVGTAILGAAESGQPLEHAFVAHCESRGTRILRVKRGQTVAIGGVEIEIQHPTADLPAGTPVNNLSIVARAPFGPKSFLFTGDIEHEIEAALDPSALPADVLKVPHHGADTSSTLPFVRAIAPAYATISTGSHGRRVMDWPIVQRYRAENIVVLRTDRHGAIRFTLRGGELEVESEREKRGYPIAIE